MEGIVGGSVLDLLDGTDECCLLGCIDGCDQGTTESITDGSVLDWLDGINDGCLLGYVDGCDNDTMEGIEDGSVFLADLKVIMIAACLVG